MLQITRTALPRALVLTVAVLTVMTAQAEASPPVCAYYPPEQWLPQAEIEAFAATLDVAHAFVQAEAGCWAIIYKDHGGEAWELLLDPATGLGEVLRPT